MRHKKAWLVLMAIGFVLIAIGIAMGEVQVVVNKAIYTCYECIGIG